MDKKIKKSFEKKTVYTAFSKHFFYYRKKISQFVFLKNKVPFNPFMNFGYFLDDLAKREVIIEGNNQFLSKCDEVWLFGPVSNGVYSEILHAKKLDILVKFFKIEKPHFITEISLEEVNFEDDVKNLKKQFLMEFINYV